MGSAKTFAHRLLQQFGIDVRRFPERQFRIEVLERIRPDVVLDVGANTGQWAAWLRARRYRGEIVSFEPLAEPFARLQAVAAGDPAWEALRLGLGPEDATGVMNVTSNDSMSSSLLPIAQRERMAAHAVTVVGQEEVPMRRLDGLGIEFRRAYLKIDAQGTELGVLEGASGVMHLIQAVEAEVSLQPLYEAQPLLGDVISFMRTRRFVLSDLERGFSDYLTGEVLQLNAIFVRDRSLALES